MRLRKITRSGALAVASVRTTVPKGESTPVTWIALRAPTGRGRSNSQESRMILALAACPRSLREIVTSSRELPLPMDVWANATIVDVTHRVHRLRVERGQVRGGGVRARLLGCARTRNRARDGVEHQRPAERELRKADAHL